MVAYINVPKEVNRHQISGDSGNRFLKTFLQYQRLYSYTPLSGVAGVGDDCHPVKQCFR